MKSECRPLENFLNTEKSPASQNPDGNGNLNYFSFGLITGFAFTNITASMIALNSITLPVQEMRNPENFWGDLSYRSEARLTEIFDYESLDYELPPTAVPEPD